MLRIPVHINKRIRPNKCANCIWRFGTICHFQRCIKERKEFK